MRAIVRTLVAAGCIVALAISLTGCQFIAQKASEQVVKTASGGKVQVNGNQVTVNGENGTKATLGGAQALPADFPSDVPVADGAKILGVVTASKGGGTAYTVSYAAPDDAATVTSWYVDQLKSQGWTIKTQATTPNGGVVIAEKDANAANVAVSDSTSQPGFKSVVTLETGPK